MGTLMKYEFRRNRANILGILLALIGLEVGLLVTWFMQSDYIALFAAGLSFLVVFTVLYIYISGVKLFSDDLTKKEGYMLFMTPSSAYKIMGAKLLSVICVATGLGLLIIGLMTLNGVIMSNADTWSNMQVFFAQLHTEYGVEMKTVIQMAALGIFYAYIGLVSIVVLGYFAVSLSATLFQNLKYKGFFSVFIFFGLIFLLAWTEYTFNISGGWTVDEKTTVMGFFLENLPSTIFEIVTAFLAFLGSGYLLNHKISL